MTRKTILFSALLLAGLFAASSCDKAPTQRYPSGGGTQDETPGDIPESGLLSLTGISSLNRGQAEVNSHAGETSRSSLMMNWRTYRLLSADITGCDKPIYPRMFRTASGELQIYYHKAEGESIAGNRTLLMTTTDMKTYTYKGVFNEPFAIRDDKGGSNKRAFADCFPLLLKDGSAICVTSYRAVSDYRSSPLSAGLVLRRSAGGGKVWDSGMSIYTGINWEPFLLQRANGDIHCYFTDSSLSLSVSEWKGVTNGSGTSLIVSKDGGATWSAAVPVVRTQRDRSGDNILFTDQMPAVIELNGGTRLAGAFEADKARGGASTDYWISFAYSRENGEWDSLGSTQEGPSDKQKFAFKGCAPYLVQFPSGETVVSYNNSSKFYMRVGDETARTFQDEVSVFPQTGYYWGSMFVDGGHELIGAVGGSAKGLQIASFVLNHNIAASARTASVDGDNAEWTGTDDALFVGSRSQAQATLRCSADKDNIYFLCECFDENLSAGDYVSIYLIPDGKASVDASARCVKASIGGLKAFQTYSGAGWESAGDNSGVEVRTAIDGTPDNSRDTDTGWLAEIAVPRSHFGKASALLVNFALYDRQGGEDAIVPTSDKKTDKWLKITL